MQKATERITEWNEFQYLEPKTYGAHLDSIIGHHEYLDPASDDF